MSEACRGRILWKRGSSEFSVKSEKPRAPLSYSAFPQVHSFSLLPLVLLLLLLWTLETGRTYKKGEKAQRLPERRRHSPVSQLLLYPRVPLLERQVWSRLSVSVIESC